MSAIDEIKNIISDSPDDREKFKEILGNPLIRLDIDELYDFYNSCKRDQNYPKWNFGALGFLLLSISIEISPEEEFIGDDDVAKNKRKAIKIRKSIMDDEERICYGFIVDEYEIDILKGKNAQTFEFHKAGTTSYILHLQFNDLYDKQELALKIPKYKYKKNRTINKETENYSKIYHDQEYIPEIFKSSATYILMKFITGTTLLEFIKEKIEKAPNEIKRFRLTYFIINKLIISLVHFSRQYGIIHKDLNPNNIIVNDFIEVNNQPRCRIYLIDFGVNYLLNDNIGSSQSLDKVASYIPEEVTSNGENASVLSDVYSLGIIILRALTKVERDEDFVKSRFEDYRDDLRLAFPLLSPILEDVLDENPDMRLFEMQKEIKRSQQISTGKLFSKIKEQDDAFRIRVNKAFADLYEYIDSIMEIELKVLVKTGIEKKVFFFRALDAASSFLNGQYLAVLFNLKTPRARYYIDEISEEDQSGFQTQTKKLFYWEIVADASNAIVWAGFLFVLAVFLGYKPFFKFREIGFTDMLAAIVLLSFSMIAVNYYKNIFSSLSTKNFNGFWPFVTNKWLRFSTFYWPFPILMAFYLGHQWWAYVASFGTMIVAINNGLNYIIAKKAVKEIKENKISQIVKDRLKDFKDWWKMMFGLSLFILIVGLLLNEHVLQDERTYLVIVLIVNIKMFTFNCTDWALHVTKTLKLIYFKYDRALKYTIK